MTGQCILLIQIGSGTFILTLLQKGSSSFSKLISDIKLPVLVSVYHKENERGKNNSKNLSSCFRKIKRYFQTQYWKFLCIQNFSFYYSFF